MTGYRRNLSVRHGFGEGRLSSLLRQPADLD